MTRTFNTREIAHLWMHKSQDSARNKRGNFYFTGDTIYSYGQHFPIAKHFPYKKGKACIFFTDSSYSSTTGQHISQVRQAIHGTNVAVFVVNLRIFENLSGVVKWHKQNIQRAKERVAEAKNKVSRAKRYLELETVSHNAIAFCQFFGFGFKFTELKPLAEIAAEVQATAKRREKLNRERQIENERIEAIKKPYYDKLQNAWRLGGNDERITNHSVNLNGKYLRVYLDDLPTMLRLNGDNVETSRGVSFPIAHSLLAMPLVLSILERGEDWHTNGHSIHIGAYKIDAIDTEGTLFAGCHCISKEELLRFSLLLKSYQFNKPDMTSEKLQESLVRE